MAIQKLSEVGQSLRYATKPVVVNESSSTNVSFSTLTNPDGDGRNYRLAVWNTNGSLVVTQGGVVQALIVDGGYSGQGVNNGSSPGGQGGNVRYSPVLALTAGTHTVTVGTGGIGVVGAPVAGGASSIGSYNTANGGYSTLPGGPGGPASSGRFGERGVPCGITGATAYYAGGGGGGNQQGATANGGTGGGGQGEGTVNSGNQTAGAANTGGGGGGRWNVSAVAGANGGSGTVIVRWEI